MLITKAVFKAGMFLLRVLARQFQRTSRFGLASSNLSEKNARLQYKPGMWGPVPGFELTFWALRNIAFTYKQVYTRIGFEASMRKSRFLYNLPLVRNVSIAPCVATCPTNVSKQTGIIFAQIFVSGLKKQYHKIARWWRITGYGEKMELNALSHTVATAWLCRPKFSIEVLNMLIRTSCSILPSWCDNRKIIAFCTAEISSLSA